MTTTEGDTQTAPLHVVIPRSMLEALREEARADDRSISAVVRRAIAAYLAKTA